MKSKRIFLVLIGLSFSVGIAAEMTSAGHGELARGPLKVRLLPGMKTPGMIFCVYNPDERHARNLVKAVEQFDVGDIWFCGFIDPTMKAFRPFLDTGKPILPYFDQSHAFKQDVAGDKPFQEFAQRLQSEYPGRFLSFGVGEWENALWTWWEKDTAFANREAFFHITADDAAKLDRKGFYAQSLDTHKNWRDQLGGRINSLTGYGLLSHLAADAGSEFIGIETGENIPATQVKRAFARGAARQYGIPWFEDVSPWYGASICVGRPNVPDKTPDGIYIGANAGHSPSMMARLWYTAWFSGAAMLSMEGSSGYFFDIPRDAPELPADVRLSEYGLLAQKLFHLMKTHDIGVPYTPFGVLINKSHGRWSVWGKPWGVFDETPGDKMVVRFFDQLFTGQSKGTGDEERYLCPSRYGDTLDVLVNDAPREAWRAYPVLLAVGEIPWTKEDIAFLKQYVEDGGILALNEINVEGWDRAYLGLKDETPSASKKTCGKGEIYIAAKSEEAAFPDALLDDLARRFLPITVQGNVQTLINRTKDGWAILLVNNNGFIKAHYTAPQVDPASTQHVKITFTSPPSQITELLADEKVEGTGCERQISVKSGEMRLIEVCR